MCVNSLTVDIFRSAEGGTVSSSLRQHLDHRDDIVYLTLLLILAHTD